MAGRTDILRDSLFGRAADAVARSICSAMLGGYLVLHYLAYLLLARSLYGMVRRLFDRSVAIVTVLVLVCNPLAAAAP